MPTFHLPRPAERRSRRCLLQTDACGEVVSLEIFAGVVGAPVGPIGLVATTDVLVAGASDSLGATDLRINASRLLG